jgi:hypothetical protein
MKTKQLFQCLSLTSCLAGLRTAISLGLLVLVPALALAEPPVKLYYVGEAKVSSADGKAMGSQAYLLEKTVDRDKATITERAVIVREDGARFA